LTNKGDPAPTFAITIEFFPSKARLGDGSVRDIERDTTVRLDVEFSDTDPQELQRTEEKAVKNFDGEDWGEYFLGSRSRCITAIV
jgi:hypothetical protein